MASGLEFDGGRDLGGESRLAGRELVAVALAAVGALATAGLDGLLDHVTQTGAVGVGEDDEGDLLVAVGGDQRTEGVALDAVRRGGAEVEVAVAAQVDRGVGGRDLGDLGGGEAVHEVQRHAGGRGADDDRGLVLDQLARRGGADGQVGGVTGVLDLVAGLGAVDATGGVDVGDGHADAGDLGRAEEREVAGQRQDAAGLEGVGVRGAVGALVVGELVVGGRRRVARTRWWTRCQWPRARSPPSRRRSAPGRARRCPP